MVYPVLIYLFPVRITASLSFENGMWKRGLARFWSTFSKPWAYVLGFVFLTATEALPAPGGMNPFFFFFLFLAGYITCADERFNIMIHQLKFKVLLCLIPYLQLYLLVLSKLSGLPDWSPESVMLAFIRNLALWLTLIVILGYGQKYLNSSSKWLAYMNQAAFPIYVIHQTILLIIGFWVVRIGLGLVPKFLIITVLSFFSCLITYDLVIRRFSVTRWIFGVKARSAPRKNEKLSM